MKGLADFVDANWRVLLQGVLLVTILLEVLQLESQVRGMRAAATLGAAHGSAAEQATGDLREELRRLDTELRAIRSQVGTLEPSLRSLRASVSTIESRLSAWDRTSR